VRRTATNRYQNLTGAGTKVGTVELSLFKRYQGGASLNGCQGIFYFLYFFQFGRPENSFSTGTQLTGNAVSQALFGWRFRTHLERSFLAKNCARSSGRTAPSWILKAALTWFLRGCVPHSMTTLIPYHPEVKGKLARNCVHERYLGALRGSRVVGAAKVKGKASLIC